MVSAQLLHLIDMIYILRNHRKTQVTRLNFSGTDVRNFFDMASWAGSHCKDSAYERTMGCSYHSPIRIPHRNVWGVWQLRLSYTESQDFADASKGTSGANLFFFSFQLYQ